MTVVITMNTSWAAFPFSLMGQAGYMASPAWLLASDADEALRSQPVGTGPFVYEDYKPNEYFKMKKNPNYWNKPFPYLDALEFRPIPDALNRRDALKSGTIDLLHTTNGETIAEFRETGEFPHGRDHEHRRDRVHAAARHAGGLAAERRPRPLRTGVRDATSRRSSTRSARGVGQLAIGPVLADQVGLPGGHRLPAGTGHGQGAGADRRVQGRAPGAAHLSLATTQDETNLTIAQFQKQWFEEAGIDEVTLDQIDQGNYILTAVLGNFQVFQWRNHGGIDLDMQYHWWHSSSSVARSVQLALNFGRIKDPQLDALLDENRASTDPARKKEIAEEVNKLFATQCYNLWGAYTIWGIPHKADVQGVGNFALPDGSEGCAGCRYCGHVLPMMTLWRGGAMTDQKAARHEKS